MDLNARSQRSQENGNNFRFAAIEMGRFQGSEAIASVGFPELTLTAEQVLQPEV